MNIEYEVRVLEIDVLNFQKKLEELGAVKNGKDYKKDILTILLRRGIIVG